MNFFIIIIIAIVFGIVEGITEWLPISSTGHMILLNQLLPLEVGKNAREFYEMFQVVIQLGAILAVVVYYWKKIWPFYNKSKGSKTLITAKADPSAGKIALSMNAFWMWVKIVVACIPAIAYGLIFDDKVTAFFAKKLPNGKTSVEVVVVAVMLIVLGVMFIVVESRNNKKEAKINSITDLSYKAVMIIGLWQMLAAMLPGTSRSGATIMGAILIGVSRATAAEFTFFLGIPVMFGASLLKILKFGLDFTFEQTAVLIIAMVVAFAVSMVVIKFLMDYIKKHDFKIFGWYRIVLGAIVLLCGIVGVI